MNWRSLRYNLHVVEVRKNVKLPDHRLERWVPHLRFSLGVRCGYQATTIVRIKEHTRYRRCVTMYVMKRPTAQKVGGIADCHTMIMSREVHFEKFEQHTGRVRCTIRTWTARSAYTRFLD